jgi:hypothetical protein
LTPLSKKIKQKEEKYYWGLKSMRFRFSRVAVLGEGAGSWSVD